MRKKLTELTTSIQWVACECGSPHTHRKDCSGRTHRKFLVQSDIEDDSYWLCRVGNNILVKSKLVLCNLQNVNKICLHVKLERLCLLWVPFVTSLQNGTIISQLKKV